MITAADEQTVKAIRAYLRDKRRSVAGKPVAILDGLHALPQSPLIDGERMKKQVISYTENLKE
jgi:hypothetical protein